MSKTKKFSWKKFFKRLGIVLLVLFGILLLLFIIFHKLIFDAIYLLGKDMEYTDPTTLEYPEMHLTTEQMLADYEYFYDHLYTDSLVREQAEKYLDLDYAALYDTYKERISNCKDDYEFFCLLSSLQAKLPGSHNYLQPPTDDVISAEIFPLSYELNDQDVIGANYSYFIQFEDRMFSYDQKYVYFNYAGGDYYAHYDSFDESELIPGIKNGRLLTLNGVDIDEAIGELDTLHQYSYDAETDKMFVKELIFNDGYGEKYVAEIELPDGRIVTVDLYNSCENVVATYFKNKLYPDHYSKPEESDEDDEDTEEEPAPASDSYKIEKIPERDIVVITIFTCDAYRIDEVYEEITSALNEVDPKAVIIDNRNNRGGNCDFVTKGVCPALFDHDFEFISYARTPVNDMTDLLYGNSFYSTFFEEGLKKEADYYRYCEDFSFTGKAEKSYKIYVLNGHSTFSSGDILAGIFSMQPEVTTIGSNSGGEGFSGHPMNFYLPESKFIFTMEFSVSEAFPDDNYLGITPDVYVSNTWENWLDRVALTEDPDFALDITSFEGRLMWDKVMIETVNMIENEP